MSKLIGTNPNQVPSNADLGNMAFQNNDGVRIKSGKIDELLGIPDIKDTIPDIKPSLNLDFMNNPRIDNRFDFNRYSKGSYYDKDGIIRYADIGEPRFSYDVETGNCKGLLLEKAATNLVYWSDIPAPLNASYMSTVDGAAPDGGTAGLYKVASAVSNTRASARNRDITGSGWSNISITSAGYYTHSVYLKPVNWPSRTYSHWDDSADSGYAGANIPGFTLPTDKSSVFLTGHSSTGPWYQYVEHIKDDWWRASLTFYHPGGIARNTIMMGDLKIVNNYNGGESSYFWGMQTEGGRNASSYIKTKNYQVTRAVDTLQMQPNEFKKVYNYDEVTFIIDAEQAVNKIDPRGLGSGYNQFTATVGSASSNYIGLGYMGADDEAPFTAQAYLRNSETSTFTWSTHNTSYTRGVEDENYNVSYAVNNKHGMTGDDNEWFAAWNGRISNTFSHTGAGHDGMPSESDLFTLKAGGNAFSSSGTYAFLRKVTLYKKKVTKPQLRALTER